MDKKETNTEDKKIVVNKEIIDSILLRKKDVEETLKNLKNFNDKTEILNIVKLLDKISEIEKFMKKKVKDFTDKIGVKNLNKLIKDKFIELHQDGNDSDKLITEVSGKLIIKLDEKKILSDYYRFKPEMKKLLFSINVYSQKEIENNFKNYEEGLANLYKKYATTKKTPLSYKLNMKEYVKKNA